MTLLGGPGMTRLKKVFRWNNAFSRLQTGDNVKGFRAWGDVAFKDHSLQQSILEVSDRALNCHFTCKGGSDLSVVIAVAMEISFRLDPRVKPE